jgi:hypothetical protein
MNNEYMTISHYFEEKSKILGKVATYDLLIEGLERAILESTVSGHLVQYELDDGQMKCRTTFRKISDLVNAMTGLQKLRQGYINRYNGRITVLRGGNL